MLGVALIAVLIQAGYVFAGSRGWGIVLLGAALVSLGGIAFYYLTVARHL